jgi:hypothetical protein
VDYYIEPSEIFNENDFVQQVNNTLLKSDFINEYQINKPNSNRPPVLLEVVKDRYLCINRSREGEYYAKDEIFDDFLHMFVTGDVWKLFKFEDGEYGYECIKGVFKGESTEEVYWEYNDSTKDFFKILKR